jgi:Cu(I)/Ag(I) efflux system membrane protein CusA/SilA
MMDHIIEFSARNRFLVMLLAAAAGWWSLYHVPLDAIPDLGDTRSSSTRDGTAARTLSKTK